MNYHDKQLRKWTAYHFGKDNFLFNIPFYSMRPNPDARKYSKHKNYLQELELINIREEKHNKGIKKKINFTPKGVSFMERLGNTA